MGQQLLQCLERISIAVNTQNSCADKTNTELFFSVFFWRRGEWISAEAELTILKRNRLKERSFSLLTGLKTSIFRWWCVIYLSPPSPPHCEWRSSDHPVAFTSIKTNKKEPTINIKTRLSKNVFAVPKVENKHKTFHDVLWYSHTFWSVLYLFFYLFIHSIIPNIGSAALQQSFCFSIYLIFIVILLYIYHMSIFFNKKLFHHLYPSKIKNKTLVQLHQKKRTHAHLCRLLRIPTWGEYLLCYNEAPAH